MPADLLISGGTINLDSSIEALAVKAGRIQAIGNLAELRRLVGPHTESYDLAGRTLLPGFIDAHVHPLTGGLKMKSCALYEATNAAQALDMVAAYAQAHPERDWIWGGGWSLAWFPGGTPDAASLDRVTGNRPALLYMADGHGAWVNGVALRLAGITADTPDPPDGRIERLADGSPQGTLHEGAMGLVERLVPEPSASDWEEALAEGQRYLLSCGVTGWQDADVRMPQHRAYLAVAGRGELRANVVGATWWERERGLDQIEDIVARRAEMAPGYRPTVVKLMLDGIVENYTAALLDSYLDVAGSPTGNTGIDFIERGVLLEAVTTLDRLGFHCHFHAIGDRAVRHALDAVEAARLSNGASTARHHVAHLQLVDPADRPRFASLDVAANAQPLWAAHEPQMDELTIPFLPPGCRHDQYPFASLLAAGAAMGMGSDWPVSTADVMKQVEVAVTRKSPYYRLAPPYAPEQAIGVDQAVEAFTAGSARINGWEQYAGAIAEGMRADLVVLNGNPQVDSPIGDIEVDLTFIAGEAVYER